MPVTTALVVFWKSLPQGWSAVLVCGDHPLLQQARQSAALGENRISFLDNGFLSRQGRLYLRIKSMV